MLGGRGPELTHECVVISFCENGNERTDYIQ